jgi:hypothetical protein
MIPPRVCCTPCGLFGFADVVCKPLHTTSGAKPHDAPQLLCQTSQLLRIPKASEDLFEQTSELLGLAPDPNHLRYHAPSAFQNSMKTPEPMCPPFACDVLDTLTAQPMPPVDPLKQTKQVRLNKVKQNKLNKKKASFGKKKKGLRAGQAQPVAPPSPALLSPASPAPASPPAASPPVVLPNGFYTIPMGMPQEAFIVPHRWSTAFSHFQTLHTQVQKTFRPPQHAQQTK